MRSVPRPNTMTAVEAAERIGVTTQRIYQLVQEGLLQAVRWPRHTLILRTSVDALVAERRAAP
jgi:excisionase family DNA binding protein